MSQYLSETHSHDSGSELTDGFDRERMAAVNNADQN